MLATYLFGALFIAGVIRVVVGMAIDELGYYVRLYKQVHNLGNSRSKSNYSEHNSRGSMPRVPITDFYEKEND